MATIISTQQRANPLALDTATESTGSILSAIGDAIAEVGYCLKLSAQSLSFAAKTPAAPTHSPSSAARMDIWPVDLWVF